MTQISIFHLQYTKEILKTYSEITNLQPKPVAPTKTKSGRQIKKPIKLDL